MTTEEDFLKEDRPLFSRELVGSSTDVIVSEAIEAENLGFDYLWVPDHLVDIQPLLSIFDAWTTLAYIGAKTRKVKLASGVTDIQRMHPAKTANIVATLDNLTNGRAVLGIGSGEIMNTRPYGIEWEEKRIRLNRLREFLTVVKLLWSSSYDGPSSFDGTYYRLVEAQLSCLPVQKPNPKIYIGAFSSKAMLRLVGELADGWYPGSQYPPEIFKEKVQLIREAAAKANRSYGDIDIMASIPTFVCKDESYVDTLKIEIKNALRRKMILSQYLLDIVGVKENEFSDSIRKELDYQFAVPGRKYDEALQKAVDKFAVPEEILDRAIDRMVAIGSVDHCISSIERYIKAGATHIFFSNLAAKRENYRLVGEEIIPRLSGR